MNNVAVSLIWVLTRHLVLNFARSLIYCQTRVGWIRTSVAWVFPRLDYYL